MDWLKKLKEYAPDIAAAVVTGGASIPASVAKAVSKSLGSTVNDQTDLAVAIGGATHEQMLALKQENNNFVLEQMRLQLNDIQSSHHETQETIRSGDNATDERIRWVRPEMAKQSWTATIAYCIGCLGVKAITDADVFNFNIAMIIAAPAYAYFGLRQIGKGIDSYTGKVTQK
jgi:hypothetical protein